MEDGRSLFLLIGQSNMAGRGRLDDVPALRDPRISMFRENRWSVAEEPLHTDKPETAGIGLGMSFATTLLADGVHTSIGLIPCAVGGTPLSRWMPGADLYQRALETTRAALVEGSLCAILWHQGEADSKVPEDAASYGQRLQEMIEALRSALPAEEIPFITGELGPFVQRHDGCIYYKRVNQQLMALEETLPRYGCVSAAGLTDNGDSLHFDAMSLREFGRRYAGKYEALR